MNRYRAVAVGGLALVALWWLASPRDSTDAPGTSLRPGAPPDSAKRSMPERPSTTRRAKTAIVSSSSSDDAVAATADPGQRKMPSRRSALENYLRNSRYPPTSRPLSLSNDDLIHPNKRHDRKRASEQDSDVTYLFTADRFFVNGAEPLTATLQVWREDTPIEPQVVSAGLSAIEPALGSAIPISFTVVNGTAVATIVPSQIFQETHAMIMALEVTFAVADGTESATINFQFTPPAGIPARFADRFADRLDGGSLIVDVGIEVFRPGYYVIDANLWAGDEPVAWTRFKGDLDTSRTSVPLNFFGKAIRARGLEGPYRIGELRGARFDEGRQPDMDQMAMLSSAFETSPYPLDAFSDAEWTSPFKERKIRALQRATLDPATGDPGSSRSDAPASTDEPEAPSPPALTPPN